MREIKFRAYHRNSNKMLWFDIMNGNHGHGNGYIGMTPFGEEITKRRYRDNIHLVDPTDCEIMQQTGLKDNNDKDIYERDILRLHLFTQEFGANYGVQEGEIEYIGSIEFGELGLLFKHGEEEDESFYLVYAPGMIHEESFEIIGNIHENPELLENK